MTSARRSAGGSGSATGPLPSTRSASRSTAAGAVGGLARGRRAAVGGDAGSVPQDELLEVGVGEPGEGGHRLAPARHDHRLAPPDLPKERVGPVLQLHGVDHLHRRFPLSGWAPRARRDIARKTAMFIALY